MMAKDYGGNAVREIKATQPGRHVFSETPYTYYLMVVENSGEFHVHDLLSFSVYLLSKDSDVQVTVSETGHQLLPGDAVQVESAAFSLTVVGSGARLLVAGTHHASSMDSGVVITPAAQIRKVSKPWGHELWINGQHPNYALKKISINPGTKTSLQYHRLKQETNILFEGRTRLSFKSHEHISNDEVGEDNLGFVDLEAVSAIDVVPMVVHRLEALTEILLYEVSTPHLDDVVRIKDDSGRPDGYISGEHKA